MPAGADAALTACLLLAYAALLLRFVAVHGLREGAHAAGFEDEPALRPALRGLVAAAAAAFAGYTAAAVGAVVLYGAADPAVAHGVSFLALALRVVEMAVSNRLCYVVRHLLALGTKRSHLEIHKQAFAHFDRDRDGALSRAEHRAYLEAVGGVGRSQWEAEREAEQRWRRDCERAGDAHAVRAPTKRRVCKRARHPATRNILHAHRF